MAKLTEFDLKAIRALAREFNVDRHAPSLLQRCFIVSVGRIFLRDMKRLEAIDPDVVEWDDRQFWINGRDLRWPGQVSDQLKSEQWTRYYVARHEASIRHVVDWLDVAVREYHPWFDNIDERGRPKKLMKHGSVETLVGEAERQLTRQRQRTVHALRDLTSDDLRWVCDLDFGLRLVQLLSPEALDNEGKRMRHCIGLGSYDAKLDDPDVGYYSVRDGDEQSLATIEVEKAIVRQFVGAQNGRPREDVAIAVGNLMIRVGWMHWIEVYEQDVANFGEYHKLCRLLGMPYHVGAMERFRLASDVQKATDIARLRASAGLGPDDPIPEPPTPAFEGIANLTYEEIVIGDDGEPMELCIDRDTFLGRRP